MRRFLLTVFVIATCLVCSAILSSACGDKLLVLAPGVRFGYLGSPYHPLIIAYVPESLSKSAAVNDPQFQAALRKAGVVLRLVQQEDVLAEAIQSGKCDVILVDLQDANMVDGKVITADVNTVVMPVVYKGAEAKSAPYRCERKASDKKSNCFSTIDKAIELKHKRDEQQRRASKN